ncbi:hypothetical protein NLG97_g2432 [Lecanicillium saksenae]|uniref:Uncharacterized protein n=1 Tax=Lecanicillium saksenae TaxID=468837 RepID=A0ACC1R2S3_9HYPO|nr:hypothetical protein NLG97_g2432 [Lecanicillium saksenae]
MIEFNGGGTPSLQQTATACAYSLAGFTFYALIVAVYNVYFHPLRKFPGPVLCRASSLLRYRHLFRGTSHLFIHDLHMQFGPVVRVAPNELSFISPEAWKDIHSPIDVSRNDGEFVKDPKFYSFMSADGGNLVTVDLLTHQSLRKEVASGFSERSIQSLEPIFQEYLDLLIRRLRDHSSNGATIDLRDWITYFSFDVIGKVALGSDFGCLEHSDYHPWVQAITTWTKEFMYIQMVAYHGFLWLIKFLMSVPFLQGRETHLNLTKTRLKSSLASKREEKILLDTYLNIKQPLDFRELHSNISLLLLAGSDTTATLLISFFALLSENPAAWDQVCKEYLQACINECMRVFPPNPVGAPRVTPKGGKMVADHWVPAGTIVSVAQWSAFRHPDNFADSDHFRPERFLKLGQYADDKFSVFQPFSYGHRNCLGRSFAYAEARLTLARLVYNFDFTLSPESSMWTTKQKAYVMWSKGKLQAVLNPIR